MKASTRYAQAVFGNDTMAIVQVMVGEPANGKGKKK